MSSESDEISADREIPEEQPGVVSLQSPPGIEHILPITSTPLSHPRSGLTHPPTTFSLRHTTEFNEPGTSGLRREVPTPYNTSSTSSSAEDNTLVGTDDEMDDMELDPPHGAKRKYDGTILPGSKWTVSEEDAHAGIIDIDSSERKDNDESIVSTPKLRKVATRKRLFRTRTSSLESQRSKPSEPVSVSSSDLSLSTQDDAISKRGRKARYPPRRRVKPRKLRPRAVQTHGGSWSDQPKSTTEEIHSDSESS